MKVMKRTIPFFFVIALLVWNIPIFGQLKTDALVVSGTDHVVEQLALYPQEKLHLHIDKSLYVTGETIWFRAWLVDAALHTPTAQSAYVYVELINPLDSIVRRVRIKSTDGAFYGQLVLDENLVEGNYTVCAYTEYMQNQGKDYFFRKQVYIGSPLSSKIHTDIQFLPGANKNTVKAELIFTNIENQRKIKDEPLSIQLNNQLAEEIKLSKDSVFHFNLKLDKNNSKQILYIESGKLKKYISVPSASDDFDVSFYPEGGNLLEDVPCLVAFKALKADGSAGKITGRLLDKEGTEYLKLSGIHEGMGGFAFKPQPGKTYYAECTNEEGLTKRFPLPKAQTNAYGLSVETEGDTIYASVLKSFLTNNAKDESPLYLLLHSRGIIQYFARWNKDYSSLSFEKQAFPSGVLQALLLDEQMNPLSERLIFCTNDDQAGVKFQADKESYKVRFPVNAKIEITDIDGYPALGNFSVSVTDDSDVPVDSTETILTSLLLSSELKGRINDPGFYFRENNPLASTALDLLMLTQGWRRYDIPQALKANYETPAIPVEKSMAISGTVKSLIRNKPIAKSRVYIFAEKTDYLEETQTDDKGRFTFNGFECPDSTVFVVQALTEKGGDKTELLLDPVIYPKALSIRNFTGLNKNAVPKKPDEESFRLNGYIAKADLKYTIENGMRTIYLDEVTVKGKRIENEERHSFFMPKNVSSVYMMTSEKIDEIQPISLSDLITHFPFVEARETDEGMKAFIMSKKVNNIMGIYNETNYATLVIDDMITRNYDLDNMIDPSGIEKIAVLKSAFETFLLGADGIYGAIVITTKKGFVKKPFPIFNIKSATPLGIQKPVEFYSPKYETTDEQNDKQPDLRTTIYWNPNVQLSPEGNATIDFYTADAAASYSVVIEGITLDGQIIRSVNKINVK
ncbi:hypothetical protein FACS189426_20280 [Bacteroidia bacterium]|nr:hypothetical protein FACS189426_20280 [Bacteroidia bacterium]